MGTPEQSSIQLPVSTDVIVEITESVKISAGNVPIFNGTQFLYSSTQEITAKLVKVIAGSIGNHDFLAEGIKARVLESGKKWITGKIRLRLVVEFIPDELENNGTSGELGSLLDDLRNKNI